MPNEREASTRSGNVADVEIQSMHVHVGDKMDIVINQFDCLGDS